MSAGTKDVGPITPTPDALFNLALNGGGTRADALMRIYRRGVEDGRSAQPRLSTPSAAQAWDEGRESVATDMMQALNDDGTKTPSVNPYRVIPSNEALA